MSDRSDTRVIVILYNTHAILNLGIITPSRSMRFLPSEGKARTSLCQMDYTNLDLADMACTHHSLLCPPTVSMRLTGVLSSSVV